MYSRFLLARPFFPLLILLILFILMFNIPRAPAGQDLQEAPLLARGNILEEPAFGEKTTSFLLGTKRLYVNGRGIPGAHKLKVYVKGRMRVSYGDGIDLAGMFSRGGKVSNPGQFDMERYLAGKNILGTVYVQDPQDIVVLSRGGGIVYEAIRLKNRILQEFKRMLPEKQAVMLGSILFGTKASPVPAETVESYRKSGVVHILVASGNRVSILLGICLALRRSLGLAPWMSTVLASFLIWSFTAMAGFGPSIVRASVMGQITLLGGLLEREADFYNTLCASAFFILIFNPLMLFDIGFQLSFAATWSFVYLAPVFSGELKPRMPPLAAESFSAALSPFLATLPITLYYFSTVSFVGVFANMLVVPLTEVITTIGFVSSFIAAVAPVLAYAPALVAAALIIVLDAIVVFFSRIPGAFGSFCRPHPMLVFIYYAGLVYTVERMKKNGAVFSPCLVFKAVFLAAAVFFTFTLSSAIFAQRQLEITVLDVGQGDSIFIKMPGGENILIDAGPPKAAKKVILPFLSAKGVNKIDLAVLTHAHDDHVGGFPSILENVRIDKVLDPGVPHASAAYRRFLALIGRNNIKYSNPRAGQILSFGEVKAAVLAPFEYMESNDLNDSSIVLRFVYGDHAFLFTGDAGVRVEERMMAFGFPLKSDVLKVGHHGSRTSTGEHFLRAVRPSVAVIPVAAVNRYGHPSPGVIDMLSEKKIRILRTDVHGAVRITSDGHTLSVSSVKN
jgi:competence protein ComEC